MAALLGIAEGAEVFQLRRLRLVGEEIVGYERRTMLADIARRIPATALEGETAIAMVEAALGARLSDLEVTVLAETASAELAQLLACRRGAALLVRRHVFRDPGGRIVLAGESCYRGDRYRFTYHLGRNGMAGRFSGEASDA
jgi:GntR family transcriptional regulator